MLFLPKKNSFTTKRWKLWKVFFYLIGVTNLPCNWSGGDGKLTPYIQGSPPTVTASTTDECRDQCMNQTTFICAAVNYKLSDRTCELLAENNQTASVAL